MKAILEFLEHASLSILGFFEQISLSILNSGRYVTDLSLHFIGNSLYSLASILFMIGSWEEELIAVGDSILYTKDKMNQSFQKAIEDTFQAIQIAKESVQLARSFAQKFLYENTGISSVIGSSHHNKFGLSDIELSFRLEGKDQTAEEIWLDFKNSKYNKLILLIPGLFCDETLWENATESSDLHIVSFLKEQGYYPIFLRFNAGLHISTNGQKLAKLLETFCKNFQTEKLDLLTYSQGGLIFRSALYYERKFGYSWRNCIGKVVFLSSPDRGSYLEKIGFWLGFLFELSPDLALKIIGMLGNLRSDGIKDLSHGIIREEEWKTSKQVRRYATNTYYGELDDINAFQIYSVFSENEDWFSSLLGDGIVETPSLEYLTETVFLKKENPELRSLKILGQNHFSVLNSKEFRDRLQKILIES